MGKLMTSAEVAAVLRVDEQTVRIWARDGRLKASRIGSQWRFRPEDVEAFVNEATPRAA